MLYIAALCPRRARAARVALLPGPLHPPRALARGHSFHFHLVSASVPFPFFSLSCPDPFLR